MEEIAGSAVARAIKGVGWIAFHVADAVGDLLATRTPRNKRSKRSDGGA